MKGDYRASIWTACDLSPLGRIYQVYRLWIALYFFNFASKAPLKTAQSKRWRGSNIIRVARARLA